MAGYKRSDDWGFPRWRPYGKSRETTRVRTCDRDGCEAPGDRPAPKAPNSPERWFFCEAHAAEYNRNWDYFTGLDADGPAREADEIGQAAASARPRLAVGRTGDGSGAATKCAARPLELEVRRGLRQIKAAYAGWERKSPDLRWRRRCSPALQQAKPLRRPDGRGATRSETQRSEALGAIRKVPAL